MGTHSWGFSGTDRPDVALAAAHAVAAVQLPNDAAWAVLPPDAREKLRKLRFDRYERELGVRKGKDTSTPPGQQKDAIAEVSQSVSPLPFPGDKFMSFHEFRQILSSNPGMSYRPPSQDKTSSKVKPWKHAVTGKSAPTPRLRELHIF